MRREGWILMAAAAWTVYVWVTRAFTLARQDASTSFKVVHAVLVVVSIAFGLAVAWVGLKLLRMPR